MKGLSRRSTEQPPEVPKPQNLHDALYAHAGGTPVPGRWTAYALGNEIFTAITWSDDGKLQYTPIVSWAMRQMLEAVKPSVSGMTASEFNTLASPIPAPVPHCRAVIAGDVAVMWPESVLEVYVDAAVLIPDGRRMPRGRARDALDVRAMATTITQAWAQPEDPIAAVMGFRDHLPTELQRNSTSMAAAQATHWTGSQVFGYIVDRHEQRPGQWNWLPDEGIESLRHPQKSLWSGNSPTRQGYSPFPGVTAITFEESSLSVTFSTYVKEVTTTDSTGKRSSTAPFVVAEDLMKQIDPRYWNNSRFADLMKENRSQFADMASVRASPPTVGAPHWAK